MLEQELEQEIVESILSQNHNFEDAIIKEFESPLGIAAVIYTKDVSESESVVKLFRFKFDDGFARLLYPIIK